MKYESEDRKDRSKIVDIKYTLFPSFDFVKEQKAADKRTTDQLIEAKKSNLRIVDK